MFPWDDGNIQPSPATQDTRIRDPWEPQVSLAGPPCAPKLGRRVRPWLCRQQSNGAGERKHCVPHPPPFTEGFRLSSPKSDGAGIGHKTIIYLLLHSIKEIIGHLPCPYWSQELSQEANPQRLSPHMVYSPVSEKDKNPEGREIHNSNCCDKNDREQRIRRIVERKVQEVLSEMTLELRFE